MPAKSALKPSSVSAATGGYSNLLAWIAQQEEQEQRIVRLIRELVEIESPSDNRAAAQKCGDHIAQRLEGLGGKVTRHRSHQYADHIQADFTGSPGKPVLLLGHYDTVWPVGTLENMPCQIQDGKLKGPGTFDMKAGIALMLTAIEAWQKVRGGLPRPVKVLLVADEEVGSSTSRRITESLARESAAVLVCEPAGPEPGSVKTARKGVGEFKVKVHGVASHAGLDFEKGHSAILELMKQIEVAAKFTDLKRGITVNPGVIRGGTRTNVVAEEAQCEFDVRIAAKKDGEYIENKFGRMKPFNKKCQLIISGGVNRPPLERTKKVERLAEIATEIARGFGVRLKEHSVGGGSDGNFTSGIGLPTLDGLGGVGDGAHAAHEHVVVTELPRRAALIAGLIERV